MRKYDIKVVLFKQRGEHIKQEFDIGRKVRKKDGTVSLKLWYERREVPYPDGKYIYITHKGKEAINFFVSGEGEYTPIELKAPNTSLEPVEKETLFYYTTQVERLHEKYKKEKEWWEKYGQLIGLGVIVAALIFVTIFVTNSMVKISAIAQATSANIARAAEIITQQGQVLTQAKAAAKPPF